MKNTRKILALVIAVMMIMTSIAAFGVSAADATTLYFKPCSEWLSDNARFAAYCWNASGNTWIAMTKIGEGLYSVEIPSDYTGFLFARMNPNTTANGWGSEYWGGKTKDLTFPTDGTNLFTVNSGWPENNVGVSGSWSTYSVGECVHAHADDDLGTVVLAPTCTEQGTTSYICTKCSQPYETSVSALGHSYGDDGLCTREGCTQAATYTVVGGQVVDGQTDHLDGIFGQQWSFEVPENDMTRGEDGTYTKIYTDVPAGKYEYKVVLDRSWNTAWGESTENAKFEVETDGSTVVISINHATKVVSAEVTGPATPGACEHTPLDEGVTTPATCTEKGKTTHTCSKCGESYDVEIPALGHAYGDDGLCTHEGCTQAATYTVVGGQVVDGQTDHLDGIFGKQWSFEVPENDMTRGEDGIFTKVYTNVPAGNYQYKVVLDRNWDNGHPDENAEFTVEKDGSTVTITINHVTGEVNAVVEAPADTTPSNPTTDPTDPADPTDPVEPDEPAEDPTFFGQVFDGINSAIASFVEFLLNIVLNISEFFSKIFG